MKYLRKFETDVEKSAWQFSDECIKPNVVLVGGMVEYNVLNPAEMPMYIEALEDLTVKFSNTYEYSKDNTTWFSGTSSTEISATAGEYVYFRASGLTPSSSNGIGRFTISNGTCNVGGNVMSMVYGSEFNGKTEITATYQFYKLFANSPKIIDAGALVLPATSLTNYCYGYMFYICTSLVNAPKLPAINLANYCYDGMFRDCTSLVNAPELPATKLADYCYEYMFFGCTSLANAPKLPATSLKYYCYDSMFYGCTSLVNAPELPAINLSRYCYGNMFTGCSNLKYVKAMFTTSPGSNYTSYWLSNVAAEGTFVKNAAATWNVTGVSGIPEGWTVETAEA